MPPYVILEKDSPPVWKLTMCIYTGGNIENYVIGV